MKLLKQGNRKKLLIIIASAVLVAALIAGGVYWLMKSTESGAIKSIDKSRTDVGNAFKALNLKLTKKELTGKERVGAFDQLQQSLEKVSDELCKDQKGSVVYSLTKAKKQCDNSRQKLTAVTAATQKIEDSIKDDQALAAVMAPAKANDPTDPAKQLEVWTTIVSKLQTTKVSSSSMEFKKGLADISTQYKTAWQDLVTADKERNKANYEGTIKRLQAVQQAIVKISEQQSTQLTKLTADLKAATTAYQKG